jgi:2-C-methyl-D-erythritol 4-phosphate cytidylyltransferase
MKQTKNIGLVFAGGIGTRMNSKSIPKQFLIIHGKPILIHTLDIFEKTQNIDNVVIVMVEDKIDYTKKLLKKHKINKVSAVVAGGETGQQSIFNGLQKIQKLYGEDCIVLIHDGVRPLIDSELIDANISSVQKNGNAISGVKCTETILVIDDKSKCEGTVNRSKAWLGRAPQSFYIKDILGAHNKAIKDNLFFIDSATMMQHYGMNLHIVECKNSNIKVTTQEDYKLMRVFFDIIEDEQFL